MDVSGATAVVPSVFGSVSPGQRGDERLSASLTRSTDFAGVIPLTIATSFLDRFLYFNGPLVPATAAVPDIAINSAEDPVGVTTAAHGQSSRGSVVIGSCVRGGSASLWLDQQRQLG